MTAARLAHLDNLKVALVAWIIAGHALVGYSTLGGWQYADVKETALAPGTEAMAGILFGPTGLFVVGMFFFVSGLLTPTSLARKGTSRFVRDRLVRLGIPVAVFTVGVWPALMYAIHRVNGERLSYWWWLWHGAPRLDSGPLWFPAVLLIFSLAYAWWRHRRPVPTQASVSPLTGWQLTGVMAGLAIGDVLVGCGFR